jgi:acid stress-induced BolA-like protein IbaG/YrbA
MRMPTADDVKARIEAKIPGAKAEVESPDNVHFNARVVADAFAGLSRIEQHRLVYAAFEGGELGGDIHALQLRTETP